MSFRAVWALWLAWVSMDVPAWTSTFHFARFVVSWATSTFVMLLTADCRLVMFVVNIVAAKLRRLCSAPLTARIVATFWSAPVMAVRSMLPRLVTPVDVRAPMPEVLSLRNCCETVTAWAEARSSVVATERLAELVVPNSAMLLKDWDSREVSWVCSWLNSLS